MSLFGNKTDRVAPAARAAPSPPVIYTSRTRRTSDRPGVSDTDT